MFRFTIRDMLWLTVLIGGLLVGAEAVANSRYEGNWQKMIREIGREFSSVGSE